MEYIAFTEEEKERAGAVNLVEFLTRQGEEMEPSGSEWRWKRHDSVTVRDNIWYRHSCKYGGSPIQFLQEFYDMTYVEAMKSLLEGNYQPVIRDGGSIPLKTKNRGRFQLPEPYENAKRVMAYLSRTRFIDYGILRFFIAKGDIYEEKKRHNVVFVGFDNQGNARHAHMKGTYTNGESFRLNVEGSDPAYGFGYSGKGLKLYVFEAAIDLLSFLTLYPCGWTQQTYVCLDGLAEHAMLQALYSHPQIREIILCLDHDPAGIEGCYRLKEILNGKGYDKVSRLAPRNKDWNEDLKEMHGIQPVPAREHPKLQQCMKLCVWLKNLADRPCTEEETLKQIHDSHHHLRMATQRQETYKEDHGAEILMCLEDMAAAGFQRLLEIQRMEELSYTREQLANQVFRSYQPHRDRGKMRAKSEELKRIAEHLLHCDKQLTCRDGGEVNKDSLEQLILACLRLHIQITVTAEKQREELGREISYAGMECVGG